jgi:CheY-like chemotaxis protein
MEVNQRGTSATNSPTGSTPSILVVDDEDVVRSLISNCLASEGYELFLSSNADDAWRFAETCPRPFDLLITDINMPGISGIDLALRFARQYPSVPILFISGQIELTDLENQLSHLMPVQLLSKPFDILTLRETVATAIHAHSCHAG